MYGRGAQRSVRLCFFLALTALGLVCSASRHAKALDAPPDDAQAQWWQERWGTVSVSERQLSPGDTFTITATAYEGGVGEPRWTWVDAGKYKATGTDVVTISWTGLTECFERVGDLTNAPGAEVLTGVDYVKWSAPPPHSAPAGSSPSEVPPPAAPPLRFGAGTTFRVMLKVRDPNVFPYEAAHWDRWKGISANFTGNIGYLGWTDAAATHIALTGTAALKAELIVERDSVAVGEHFKITLKVTNTGQYRLTNVRPAFADRDVPEVIEEGRATVTGPSPTEVGELLQGQSTEFTYDCVAVEGPDVLFGLGAKANYERDGSVEEVESNMAASDLVAITSVIQLRSVQLVEDEADIIPGDQVLLEFKFDKDHDDEIHLWFAPEGLLTYARPEDIVWEQTDTTWDVLPDATIPATDEDEITVRVRARVADETQRRIYENVITYDPGKLSLEDQLWFRAEYELDDEQRSLDLRGSLTGQWITYPDYSAITGDPISSPTDDQANEAAYHRYGNCGQGMAEDTSAGGGGAVPYYNSAVVREMAAKALRHGIENDVAPDTPSEAAHNIAQFLADKLTGQETGANWSTFRVASWLSSNAPPPELCSSCMAQVLGAFARTVGLRTREMNNALRHSSGIASNGSYEWSRFSANQLWYDGVWNWFDIYHADKNDGRPVTPGNYPEFYFEHGPTFSPYLEMKNFHAIDQLSIHMWGLKEGGADPNGEPVFYPQRFRLFKRWARDAEELSNISQHALHITTHSPVTTLYVDAEGRRLGAAGPLTENDRRAIEEMETILPIIGGGSVWEVPGGVYIAPGTPMVNPSDPNETILLEEQIIVPYPMLTESFTITVTGTGDGAYRISAWIDAGPEGNKELYVSEGTISTDEQVQLELFASLQGDQLTVSDGSSSGTAPTPAAGGCCGASAPAALALMTLMLGRWRFARNRRRGRRA